MLVAALLVGLTTPLLVSPIPGPPPASAQPLVPITVPPPPVPTRIELGPPRPVGAIHSPTAEPGVGLRRYGLAATIAGVVLGIGGVMAATINPCGQDGANGSDCRTDIRNAAAMTMGVAGFGLITGGVISMSFGQAQRSRARLEWGLQGMRLRF